MSSLTRRRFISISAAAVTAPKVALAQPSAAWTGIALGAAARIELTGVDVVTAAPVFRALEAELDRLENIFSLYRPNSALCRLNRTGQLAAPPPELLELLSLCSVLHRQTGGAFDPSIQPLWAVLANAGKLGETPDVTAVETARFLIGLHHVRLGTDMISFDLPGMALTLNGIAQGYVTDRMTERLRSAGFNDIMVNMGEIRAAGNQPDGALWRARIATPEGDVLPNRISLDDRALATSAPLGTFLDPAGRIGHILDPRTGLAKAGWSLISVSAKTAALADGLSTACCVLDSAQMHRAVGSFRDAKIEAAII